MKEKLVYVKPDDERSLIERADEYLAEARDLQSRAEVCLNRADQLLETAVDMVTIPLPSSFLPDYNPDVKFVRKI